ncbi:peptidylprolyl isomerase [Paracidobacterium acidisoli]|uniref:Periplasmic chaperone PpiD n=1 Tax=Paracidobacterium acidisoli TaxID=2303751 RepID=A0A372IJ34_9BACT|nr:peptidylprolyl isomerase [Paracidobacterium acidisoli]MBT9333153.1 peptidylprolyl isomerase [Paracidobacterium acidisoli]
MIRFLQKDSPLTKAIFIVIIAVTCLLMVIFLVPGIFNDQASSADTYATIRRGGLIGRFLPAEDEITMTEVQQLANRLIQRQQLPEQYAAFMVPRAGQALIQQRIELAEAQHLGIVVTDDDIRHFLHTGMFGQIIFPNGQYIGDDKYTQFVADQIGLTRDKFEEEIRKQIASDRLRDLITGGVTVSDAEVRDAYLKQATKIKFEYAVLSTDDIRKTINPTDAELQTFFKQNAARYAHAIPETRKIEYIAVTDKDVPGGVPQPSQAEIQQYYNTHQQEYRVDDSVKVRHILIPVDASAGAKADADAKAKAQDILDQLHKDNGKNFAELAKKYSGDPGSKDQGGELGWIKHGVTVPEFDQTAFSLQPGQISGLVHTRYGYHIIQTEEKQVAHVKSLDEMKDSIVQALASETKTRALQSYAAQLAAEAQKSGLAQTASAHHLQLVSTDFVQNGATLPGMTDSSKLLAAAFAAKKSAPPQASAAGDGFAVFQVADVQAAHAPGFDEYKSHVLDDFKDEQVPQLLARKTNELADRAHAENDLDKAAKELGATVKTSDLVGRDQQVPDVGQLASAAPALFDLNIGQISSAINTGQAGVVAKLTDKQQPAADDVAKNLNTTREAILNQRRDEMYEVFVSSLEQRYQKSGRILLNRKAQQSPFGNS